MSHSDAYNVIKRYTKSSGLERLNGLNDNILKYVNEEEREDAEKLIIKAFNAGYYELATIVLQIRSIDGKVLLQERLLKADENHEEYFELSIALYSITRDVVFFERIKKYYESHSKSQEATMIVSRLSRMSRDANIYSLLVEIYISQEDQARQLSAILGILYADNVIESVDDPNVVPNNLELIRSFLSDDRDKRESRFNEYKR